MTKQEILEQVLTMLDRGEIQLESCTGKWVDACSIDKVAHYRVKPTILFGVEVPTPLSIDELDEMCCSDTLYTISLWSKGGTGTVTVGVARANFSKHSIVYRTMGDAVKAVTALRGAC